VIFPEEKAAAEAEKEKRKETVSETDMMLLESKAVNKKVGVAGSRNENVSAALADLVSVGSVFTPVMVCFGTPFPLGYLPLLPTWVVVVIMRFGVRIIE
jgi:hypothetical protein